MRRELLAFVFVGGIIIPHTIPGVTSGWPEVVGFLFSMVAFFCAVKVELNLR